MIGKWLHRLALAVLALLVVAGVAGLAAWRVSGLKLYVMSDNHLAPGLQRGDLLLVAPNKTPKPGDFVNYVNPGNPRDVITEKLSGRVPDAGYVGVTVKAVPLAGYALRQLRTPLGLGLLVYLPAAVIVGGEIKCLRPTASAYQFIAFTPVAKPATL
ncbi:MAG TPA: hypothetical protein VEH48_01160 [Candidatus Nitrosopolaris sp.]|nr:hypothetical protein [Candidatus Nitrosopolaris sp.]